jgi:hypothetical protein
MKKQEAIKILYETVAAMADCQLKQALQMLLDEVTR